MTFYAHINLSNSNGLFLEVFERDFFNNQDYAVIEKLMTEECND